MSDHDITFDSLPAEGEKVDVTKLEKLLRILPAIAGGGLVLCLILSFTGAGQSLAYSWLFGFYYFFTIACGGLFWVLLHNATNSGWGVAVRRVMEHLAHMVPWVFLFALPILLVPGVRESLYEWMTISKEAGSKEALYKKDYLLYQKSGYLNMGFFYLRMLIYFAVLGGGALWLRKISTEQDSTGNVRNTLRARRISCGLMPAFAVGLTFIGIDFLMCLDYTWFSTMWGVYLFAGSALSGMAAIILTVSGLKNLGYLKIVNQEHYHLMGKLMKAFTIFWAYISFSQFFLYWYANITEETKFYIIRNTSGWYAMSIFLVFGHFVVPFLFLLRQEAKKDLRQICIAACWILFVHFMDIYWIVIPERGPSLTEGGSLTMSGGFLLDVLAFVTIGASLLYIYLRTIGKHSIYPCRDPRLIESARVVN